jgi:uncharacterized protein
MKLFLAMLPVYLLGNLHCAGMCGPLVLLLGAHRFRSLYFIGRLFSFALAGLIAGTFGAVINFALRDWFVPAIASLLFGGILVSWGSSHLFGWRLLPFGKSLQEMTAPLFGRLIQAPFLFGLATALLPCGQSFLVFSACAVEGNPAVGLMNGFAFALLTSPALMAALGARRWIAKFRHRADAITAVLAILIGITALCRGFADLEWIPHLNLVPKFHIALY